MQPVLFPVLLGKITCPVLALKNYMKVRVAFDFDAPFFVDRLGEPLSRGRFNEKLKKVMCLVEPDLPGRFPSKSFRIGATSDSYALNIPIDDIGNLGRWAVVFSSLHALCNRGSIQASRYREILRYCLVALVYCW